MKAKALVRAWLDNIGLVIHRKIDGGDRRNRLFENPVEALYHEHVENNTTCPSISGFSFKCPLEHVVSSNGFNHSSQGWHPFSATLDEVALTARPRYEDSVLKHYYSVWRPASGLEAIAGWTWVESSLADLPSYVILPPWNPNTVEEETNAVRSWTLKDNREHGGAELDVSDGCNYHGPVSDRKGELEFARLCRVRASLCEKGYDRSYGDVCVNVLRRGQEYRYIAVGGHHRIAAMKSLGYAFVPATLRMHWIIDVNEVESWPQVRRGLWTKDGAESYFNHLFDFDAQEWARQRDLLRNDS